MNTIIENLIGMNTLTDQVIATDLLIAAKTGVRNCAAAVTEAATPEVRSVLRNQLKEAIELHEEITQFMMSRGWYHPYNPNEQIQLDLTNAETALNV
ncbi:spore coat protein [Effusibacillus dendaii]|uniref:Spore coat protein F-like protein YraD n=1 Tax=Effusibacillus dendaii TaxID=2743772 RepID=A0A7I8DBT7_9BACL|nr:spore coat protein [Effusibacillus dendaii]BCJ87564.1 spore coat protein F-like protein YraD [Effusibacillus dendaii]